MVLRRVRGSWQSCTPPPFPPARFSRTITAPMKRSLALVLALVACAHRPAPRAAAPVIVATSTPAPAADPGPPPAVRDDGRLPDTARPVRWAVELALDPSRPDFSGTVTVDLAVTAPTSHLVLHARDLVIDEATVTQGSETVAARTALRSAHGTVEAPEELVVTAAHPLAAGPARLVLRYHGNFSTELNGLYRVQVDGRWYAFSDFEPSDARRAFPCFDEPSAKVPVQVTLRVPEGIGAFANMPETAHDDDAAQHQRTVRFAETPPLPTYLVAVAAGPFEVYDGPTSPVPVRVLAPQGRAHLGAYAARVAAEHLAIEARYFDRPYPFPKLDLVAVPDFQSGAMENPGLITFRDSALLVDEGRASARSRYGVASIIAHELAHQWFGDLVTMAWWDDLWLNEGFATWMSTRVMDAWQPALGARIEAVEGAAWARTNDALPAAHAIRQRVTSTGDAMASFDTITYAKGAAVIGMIERWIGEEHFRDGIRAYLRDHAGGNATAADLLGALSTAAGSDVTPVAASFLDQPGVPRVAATLDCGDGHPPRVQLTQSRFRFDGAASDARWRIPVCVRWDGAAPDHTACTVLDGEHGTVDLGGTRCPRWIDANAGAAGYYVTTTSPANVRALLHTDGALDTAGLLALLADLETQVNAGTVPITTWFDALGHLATVPEPHVHQRVAESLFLAQRWIVDDANRPAFGRWVGSVLGPLARALGWRTNPGDFDVRRNARRSVLTALGTLTEDLGARQQATALADAYLHAPGSVDGELAAVALPIASRHGDTARFERLLAALPSAATPQDRALLLGSLASFDAPSLMERAWSLSLGPDIRVLDFRALFGRGDARHPGLLAAWAQAHWDEFEHRHGRNVRHLLHAVGGLCDAAAIDRAMLFFGPRAEAFDGATRSLAVTVEGARQCAAVRARSHDAATRWLDARH